AGARECDLPHGPVAGPILQGLDRGWSVHAAGRVDGPGAVDARTGLVRVRRRPGLAGGRLALRLPAAVDEREPARGVWELRTVPQWGRAGPDRDGDRVTRSSVGSAAFRHREQDRPC